ncbi:MAG: DNA-directed RNA polymerase subunit beta, partial [Oscillospiraceae bacterium]|nr:DNA-directed RNA polymerase subunit beta [Oscillospiraceae bacterium]
MVKDVRYGRIVRKSYSRHEDVVEIPNLLEVQKDSYRWFLKTGLREVFRDVAAITDYAGNLEMTFIDYTIDEHPKYSVDECKARDATYAAPIKVRVRLRNKETEEIKEQEIFMGDFPLMTKSGTFIINGAERVIVSQIVRSPGIYYDKKADKVDNMIYSATVIPYRGAWLEYETDLSDVFYVRIDKNRKIPITCLIRAIGVTSDAQILELFGEDPRIVATLEKDICKTYEESMLEVYRKLRPGEPPTLDSAQTLMNSLFFDSRRYDISAVGRYKFNKKLAIRQRLVGQELVFPVADPLTGEILAEAGERLTREQAQFLEEKGVNEAVIAVEGKLVKVFSND